MVFYVEFLKVYSGAGGVARGAGRGVFGIYHKRLSSAL